VREEAPVLVNKSPQLLLFIASMSADHEHNENRELCHSIKMPKSVISCKRRRRRGKGKGMKGRGEERNHRASPFYSCSQYFCRLAYFCYFPAA
jgi:hypothetical protein